MQVSSWTTGAVQATGAAPMGAQADSGGLWREFASACVW